MSETERRRRAFTQLTCTPSRRSTKFSAGPNARQFFFFDTTVSRTERQFLLSCLFIFRPELIDREAVVDTYKPATYTPEELVEVRVVCDPLHPAYGQAGLYAKRTIPNNTIVCPYAGFVEIFTTSCNSRTYTMGFGSSSDDYALDAEFAGNYGRFANDPRGVEGLSANVSAENRMNARGEFFTALVSRRQIGAGEEILMAYGKAHSLSSSPWTDVRGNPLMRVRRGGEVPFPHLDPHVDFTPSSADTTTGLTSTSSAPAFELYWECPQCGAWNQGEPAPLALARCDQCQSPKLAGCPQVAALSHPPVQRADLLRAAIPDLVNPAAVRVGASVDPSRAFPSSLQVAAPAAVPMASSSSTSSAASPSQVVAHAQSPGTSPSYSSPSTAAERHASSPSSVSPHSPVIRHTSGLSHHHSPSYASVHVDWPLNVPFIPWQVWDPSVPLTTVMKLSKFETHEHIFLFRVTYDLASDDDSTSQDESDVCSDIGASRKDVAGSSDGGDSVGSGAKTRTMSSTGGGPCGTAAKRQRVAAPVDENGASSSAKRPRTLSSTSEGPVRTSRTQRVSERERMARVETTVDEALLAASIAAAAEGTTPRVGEGGAGQAHSAVLTVTSAGGAAAAAAVSPSPRRPFSGCGGAALLGGLLQRPREVERLLSLPSWTVVTRRLGQPHHATCVPSPLRQASEWVRTLSQRVLSARAFDAGEMVANLGGAVRLWADSRCRPDWSPLCLPLRYLLPTSWRRDVRMAAATDSHTSCEDHDHSERLTRNARSRFLARLSTLALVATNEMMYCPCIVCPLDGEDSTKVTDDQGPSSEMWTDTQRLTYEAERQAVLAECNVVLVLDMDAMGSPFIGAVATRRIEAFEPLLARTQ